MSTAAIGRIDGLSWRNRRASAVTDVDAIATHNGVDGVARGLAWGGGWWRVGLGVVVGCGWWRCCRHRVNVAPSLVSIRVLIELPSFF